MGLAYRADIDGLRAIAVGAVVLFHGHIPPFRGGFVGVDVFFVLSGFLITSILCRDIQAQAFSLLDFYDRRVRRIFPALFVMLAGITVLAAFVLLPRQMMDYAGSLIPSALFYANIHFQQALDYFGPDANEVPLLHLWSLAVEEQFYIVFPLLLFALLRGGGRKAAAGGLVVLVLGSLLFAEYYLASAPKVAFYQLAGRAWELLVGALLALVPLPKVRAPVATGLGVLGLACVLVPVFAYDKETVFPGLAALPPVLGTALLVYAGAAAPSGRITRILSLPGFVYVGRISYSLYLWHWPLLVLAALHKTRHLTYIQSGLVILVAVGLSALSLKYVEAPLRRPGLFGGRRLVRLGAGALAILCAVGVARGLEGVDGRLWPISPRGAAALAALDDRSAFQRACNNEAEGWTALRSLAGCALGPGVAEGTYDVLVWGDSHAGAAFVGIAEEVAALGHTARLLTMPGCPPLIGGLAHIHRGEGATCAAFNAAVLDEIRRARPVLVVVVGRWTIWTERAGGTFTLTSGELPGGSAHSQENSKRVFDHMVTRTFAALDQLAPHVIVLGQVPEFLYPPTRCVAQSEYFGKDGTGCLQQTRAGALRWVGYANELLAREAKAFPHISVLPLSDLFCPSEACSAGSMEPGKERFFYVDGDHLSATGARLLRHDPALIHALAAALGGTGTAGAR